MEEVRVGSRHHFAYDTGEKMLRNPRARGYQLDRSLPEGYHGDAVHTNRGLDISDSQTLDGDGCMRSCTQLELIVSSSILSLIIRLSSSTEYLRTQYRSPSCVRGACAHCGMNFWARNCGTGRSSALDVLHSRRPWPLRTHRNHGQSLKNARCGLWVRKGYSGEQVPRYRLLVWKTGE